MLAYFAGAAGLLQAQKVVTIPGKRPMLLHNDRPEDLETPTSYFDTWITPNDVFFVRQHLPRPRVMVESFRLALDGRIEKPMELRRCNR